MDLPTKIIQCSKPRTGSTLLVNILAGLIEPELPIFHTCQGINPDGVISKTHVIHVDYWIKKYKNKYNLVFVCSNRGPKKIDDRYLSYPNVVVFDYDELLETSTNSLDEIIDCVYLKLKDKISFSLNKSTALDRIVKMNELCAYISDKPFSYHDEFYHIHGSHRTRGKGMC